MTEPAAETLTYSATADRERLGGALVADLIADRKLLHLPARSTVQEAAEFLSMMHMGAIPILSDGALEGIFTERDALVRVMAAGLDPKVTQVADVMTRDVVTVGPATTAHQAARIMMDHNIRHLPVRDGDRVVGIVSLRDLVSF